MKHKKALPCHACGVCYKRLIAPVNACPTCGHCDHGRPLVTGVCQVCSRHTSDVPGPSAAAADAIRNFIAGVRGFSASPEAAPLKEAATEPAPQCDDDDHDWEPPVIFSASEHYVCGKCDAKRIDLKPSLAEAKRDIERFWHDGLDCPACGQTVKLYKRKLNAAMARGLIELYRWEREQGDDAPAFAKIRDDLGLKEVTTRQLPTTRYWGLVYTTSESPAEDGNPKSGLYRLTDLGRAFVNGKVSVPRHAYIFNDKLRGRSKDTTTIVDALSDKFTYSELWEPIDTGEINPLLMSLEWPPIMDDPPASEPSASTP